IMKIYQKIALTILMKHAKNQIQIPSIFFFTLKILTQQNQCLLVKDCKEVLWLHKAQALFSAYAQGVGVRMGIGHVRVGGAASSRAGLRSGGRTGAELFRV